MTLPDVLAPLLRGRSVALVGNARSLGLQAFGSEIDGCDLVMRLNAAPMAEARSHGTRTDWLAASSVLPRGRLRVLGPGRLLWMSPRRRLAAHLHYGWRLPLGFYPLGWWRSLTQTLGSRPSTGVMAIDLLQRVGGLAELRLYGFDFFASGSFSDRRLAAPPPHDFAAERRHVQRLMAGGAAIRIVERKP